MVNNFHQWTNSITVASSFLIYNFFSSPFDKIPLVSRHLIIFIIFSISLFVSVIAKPFINFLSSFIFLLVSFILHSKGKLKRLHFPEFVLLLFLFFYMVLKKVTYRVKVTILLIALFYAVEFLTTLQ